MKKEILTTVMCGLLVTMSTNASADDSFDASVGGSLVSGYVWRGQDLGGVSIQPTASVAWKGLSLTAWGSVGFKDTEDVGGAFTDAKEFDLTLGYAYKGFSVSVTDYWFNCAYNNYSGEAISGNYFHYGKGETNHVFEAQIGYDFGFLAANWYTNFAGNDGLNKDGRRAYSSYFSLSAPFSFAGLDWKVEAGATPWATTFYNGGAGGFEVSEVSLKAMKAIKITDSFSLPLSAKVVWNPATEGAYFVLGVDL